MARSGLAWLPFLLAACGDPGPRAPEPRPSAPSPAGPDFRGIIWVDPAPDLRGKILLVRWWTNGCSLCAESAPVLARLEGRASVVAIYHPKQRALRSSQEIRAAQREIGMPGALGVDPEWSVLDRWMPPEKRQFTSLTFLLDRRGKVREVHPGGALGPADEKRLLAKIAELESEKD